MQDTKKNPHGGKRAGSGRPKVKTEETKAVNVVIPVSLLNRLEFNNTEESRSDFIVSCIRFKKEYMERTIQEVDKVIEKYGLPL